MNFKLSPYTSIIVLIFLFFSCNQSIDKQTGGERTISFNNDWKFHLEDSLVTNPSEFSWKKLTLPHDWSIEGDFNENNPAGVGGGALPGGIGWYKKIFKVAPADSTKINSIVFDGVYNNSEVWINEHYLGKRPNGYIGFQYNLTPYLNFGEKENEILVKVDNSQQPNSRWYSGSGIYRNVWMQTTDKLHVDQWGTFVTTQDLNKDIAEVQIDINLKNEYSEAKNATITTTLYFGEEQVNSVSEEIGIDASGIKNLTQIARVDNPRFWSIEEPQLYSAVTEIKVNDEVIDQYKTPFGIRNFNFDLKKGFILNGKQVKIKGVCLHHDLGALGSAVNKSAIKRQLQILKDMGVNGIRTSHNPPAPELLELCDEMGFIVMDEAFDMWEKSKTEYDYSNNWEEWHKKDLQDFIKRDRNHPSVFIWSIGNEIPEQWEERGAEIGEELSQIVKKLDSTRPITAGMNPANKENKLANSNALDIIGYNYAQETYADHPKNFPNKPFIATETTSALATRGYYDMPSDSIKIWPVRWDIPFDGGNPGNTVSAYDHVRAPWGSTHEETWKIIKKHDFLSGMFIWTGFDYIGEPTPYTWPSRSSYFGIIDLAGFPKDVFYMYQSEWTDKPVLHIFPHWNWEKGQEVDIWAYYNNADEVELFLNGKSLGSKHKKGDDLHVMWRLPFEPGTLKAISRRNGKTVLEKEIKTAEEASQISLNADRNIIKGDGVDLSFITVSVLDEKGTIVPNATNNIEFKIEGPGKIVGVNNGDPTSHASFKASNRNAFNGKCLVIVQSLNKEGIIKLTANSPGLTDSTINISLK